MVYLIPTSSSSPPIRSSASPKPPSSPYVSHTIPLPIVSVSLPSRLLFVGTPFSSRIPFFVVSIRVKLVLPTFSLRDYGSFTKTSSLYSLKENRSDFEVLT